MRQLTKMTGFGRSALVLCFSLTAAASDASSTFRQHCFQCHGEAATMAGINLKELTSRHSFGDKSRWLVDL